MSVKMVNRYHVNKDIKKVDLVVGTKWFIDVYIDEINLWKFVQENIEHAFQANKHTSIN